MRVEMLKTMPYPILCAHYPCFEIQPQNLIWGDFVAKLRLNLYETASIIAGEGMDDKETKNNIATLLPFFPTRL